MHPSPSQPCLATCDKSTSSRFPFLPRQPLRLRHGSRRATPLHMLRPARSFGCRPAGVAPELRRGVCPWQVCSFWDLRSRKRPRILRCYATPRSFIKTVHDDSFCSNPARRPTLTQSHLHGASHPVTGTEDHLPQPDLMAKYYRQRATAGLILSEALPVAPMAVGYARVPGIWSPAQVETWKPVTDARP